MKLELNHHATNTNYYYMGIIFKYKKIQIKAQSSPVIALFCFVIAVLLPLQVQITSYALSTNQTDIFWEKALHYPDFYLFFQ